MADNRKLAPIANEVELARKYLELELLRLGDRLKVTWRTDTMPADALVPPLVLQPLVENAVYHGIEPLTERGLLSINIFLSRDEVHAILKNPYVATGARHQVGNNMAVDNIRERLALHFDAEASLESRITKDSWEVHIRMPYRTEKPAANGKSTTKTDRTERPHDRGTHKRPSRHGRPLPATPATRIEPWLNPPCAS
jgi:two-component system sensor histidine kinase AlgZ